MFASSTGGHSIMSEKLAIEASKSNWLGRLLKVCGLLILLALIGFVSLDYYLKSAVPDKLEQLMADRGWRVEVGGFDYSILNMNAEFRDIKGESLEQKGRHQFGKVSLERVRLAYDGSQESKIGDITINGFNSKIGSIDHMDVSLGDFIRIKGWIINNPSEFGGGPLVEVKEVSLEYSKVPKGADRRFKEVLFDVSRINIVKNRNGLWLTDGIPKFKTELEKMQSKSSESDLPEIDSIIVKIGSVAFLDLSQNGKGKVINVDQSIEERNNPKGYAVGVFLRVVGVIAGAKNAANF